MTASLLPFLSFAFVASITPGPNNVMAFAIAAAHGMRAAVPLVLGVVLGFGLLVAIVGCGLAVPLARFPLLHLAMRWGGVIWILVLAWKIGHARGLVLAGARAAPPGFWTAAALQWVNPKAWILAVATTAAYTVPGENIYGQIIPLAMLFCLISIPCVGSWAFFGTGASRFIISPERVLWFNRAMGGLLAASVIPVLWE